MTMDLVGRFEKRFPGGPVIQIDLSESNPAAHVTALFGPSGCGKTTLLRCLAGLTHPDEGLIEFRGQTWFCSDRRFCLTPQQRDIGFLFQDYALFPHLTVVDNVGFGVQHRPSLERQQQVASVIKMFDLRGLEQRYPHQLSGGQQQRVALARVLARKPQLLLLDEPLSSLDTVLREQLRGELRRVLGELGMPVILVTHDRLEAIALADQVALVDGGRIQQIGSMQDVFTRPRNASLARLVGVETVTSGEIVGVHEGLATVRVGSAHLLAIAPADAVSQVHVCIRGEDVALQKGEGAPSSVRNHLPATVTSLTPEGPLMRVGLDCGFELTALVTRPASEELHLSIGDRLLAMLKAPAIHLIPRSSGQASV